MEEEKKERYTGRTGDETKINNQRENIHTQKEKLNKKHTHT